MASVQAVVAANDDVVADVADLLVVRLARLDVEVLKVEIPARLCFGAVEPDDTVVGGCSGNVLERNIVPSEKARVFALVLVVQQVCQADCVGQYGLSDTKRQGTKAVK